jgi:hypothetical protein
MALIRNISIDQGSTYNAEVVIYDDQAVVLDLTNYPNAKMQIKRNYTSINVTANPVCGSSSDTTGIVSISMTSADTLAIPAGRYVYDLIISNADDSEIIRVLEGIATVAPGVTTI